MSDKTNISYGVRGATVFATASVLFLGPAPAVAAPPPGPSPSTPPGACNVCSSVQQLMALDAFWDFIKVRRR